MMQNLIRLLVFRGAMHFRKEIGDVMAPVMPYLRKIGLGISLVVSSIIAWVTSMFFLLLALFFYLSQADAYVGPAIWTGVISLIIGFGLVFFGFNLIRRPAMPR